MFRAAVVNRLVNRVVRSPSAARLGQVSVKSFSTKASSSEDLFPLVAAASFVALGGAVTVALCETTPSGVSGDDIEDAPSLEDLPVFSSEDIAMNNGENGTPIWVSYGGMVYDVTKFIANHPGGDEKIMQAAGNVSTCTFVMTLDASCLVTSSYNQSISILSCQQFGMCSL